VGNRFTTKEMLAYRNHSQHKSNGVSPRNDLDKIRAPPKGFVTPNLSKPTTPRQHYLPNPDRPDSSYKKHRNNLEIQTSHNESPIFGGLQVRSQSAMIRNPPTLSEIDDPIKKMMPSSTAS